jgi:hypothetical protein
LSEPRLDCYLVDVGYVSNKGMCVGVLLQNGSCNDDGCDQLGPCVEYQVVLNIVEIMLTKIYHVCIYVPRVMVIFVHLSFL